ncbi:MAG: endoribonuclease YicC domain-containing protein, partial [Mycobacterium leprae]
LVGLSGCVDPPRLALDGAILADRAYITEELQRLESHLAQFRNALREGDSVGRKLDFLVQEIGREVNTIGSKANDAQITGQVVEGKSELEKIREQVQNIE